MRYKFFLLSLLLVLTISIDIVAQVDRQVKVKLNNGVKIKGAIVESLDDSYLKVRIDDSTTFLIRYNQINKINFKGYGNVNGNYKKRLSNPPTLQTETFYHELRGGLLFGEEIVNVTLQTINGYQFNKYLGTGLGLGVSKYGNITTMPLYAQVKGYLFDTKVSPFYYGDIGYGFAWNTNNNEDLIELENVQGGLYWQLGLGYQINFYNSSMTFAFGYSSQDSKVEYIYYRPWDSSINDFNVSERRILRRLTFSIGFLF